MFRPITTSDADAEIANRLLSSAFQLPGRRWDAELRRYLSIQPDGYFFLEDDGVSVAMGGAVNWSGIAYIGLVAVDPSRQRRGYGRAIMEYLLDWIDQRHIAVTLLDATVAGEPLYRALGFAPEDQRCAFVHADPFDLTRVPEPSNHIRPFSADWLDAVAAYDLAVFGADRRPALEMMMRDFPRRGVVAVDDSGAVVGYACASRTRFGPFMAESAAVAEDLLRALVHLPHDQPISLIISNENRAGVALLKQWGFVFNRGCLHMRRGGAYTPTDVTRLYSQITYALG